MRRLVAIELEELTWKAKIVETKRTARTKSVVWDPAAGVYRKAEPGRIPVERPIERRAVKLTALGDFVVDRLRPVAPTRWADHERPDDA